MRNFLTLLKTDFYRAFISAGFLVGVAATVAIFCFGSVGMVSYNVSAVAAFNNTYKYNNIANLLFLTATFAYSSSFCIDLQTRFSYPLQIRSGKTAYILSKCITTAVAGGLTVAIGAAIFIGCVCLTQPSVLPSASQIEVEYLRQAFGDLLLAGQADLYFLSYLLVIFLQAAFYASLGLFVSGFLPNKYVTYIAPFALSFMMNQIANVFRLPIWLDPVKLATARFLGVSSPGILLITAAAFLTLTLTCDTVFIHTAKRRMASV